MAQRLAAQLLAGPPAATAEQVAQRLLAVQARDPRGMRLAIRARTAGLSAAAVDHALTTDRSLVVTWLNRGTLHLVPADDHWWLHALTTPPLFAANTRRLAQEGVPPASPSGRPSPARRPGRPLATVPTGQPGRLAREQRVT